MTRVLFSDLPDAGLWRRLAAAVYDGLLLLALWFVSVGLVIIANHGEAIDPRLMQGLGLPLLWLMTAGFYAWFWLHGGQTLGMRAWRLRVVTDNHRALTIRDCLIRAAVGTLSLLCALLGFFWVLITGRTWHDLASHTRVVVLPKNLP